MFDKAYQRYNDRRLRVYYSLGMFRNVYKHSQTSKLLFNSCSQEETEVQKLRILKKCRLSIFLLISIGILKEGICNIFLSLNEPRTYTEIVHTV